MLVWRRERTFVRHRDPPGVGVLLPLALERMVDDPVVLRGARMIDLDDVATRDAVAADPATFVAGDRTVCIDEYQKAPVVLDAIKAELNRGSGPGRFVLTGSTRHDALPAAAQALTGRLSRLPIYPFECVNPIWPHCDGLIWPHPRVWGRAGRRR